MVNTGFKLALEDHIQSILEDYVGQGGIYSDPVNYVKRWDRKLDDFDLESDLPLVVITARTTNQVPRPSGEMGTSRELWYWVVDIYYLDVEKTDFNTGYARQDVLIQQIRNGLEDTPNLRGLSVPVNPQSPTGATNEYVYNNDWVSITWDYSGQEEYWAFVGEMHLQVQTARN